MFKWLFDWGEEVKNRFQAVVPGYFGGAFLSSGLLTNPAANTVLVDTGRLAAGIYDIRWWCTSGGNLATHEWEFQHRNASNDITLTSCPQGCNSSVHPFPVYIIVKVKEGERFRYIARTNFTDIITANINYTRIFPLKRGQ